MVAIVIVGHHPFATALREAAFMIFGQQPNVHARNLEHDTNLDDFTADLRALATAADDGDGVLVLADLLGGSPANAAARVMSDGVQVVTGANLPMLLEVMSGGGQSLQALIHTAQTAAASGVLHMNQWLAE